MDFLLTWARLENERGRKSLLVVSGIVAAAGGGRADRHGGYVAVEHQAREKRQYVVVVSDREADLRRRALATIG